MSEMVRIVLGGDLCPMGAVQKSFASGEVQQLFAGLRDEIASADFSVVNLECPLISRSTPAVKSGVILGAPVDCVSGIIASKWSACNLANNHSFDHGAEGLHETIGTIKEARLQVVGAGMNLAEAQAPLIQQIKGRRFVMYAMAEREFSQADEHTPGANPLDLIRCVEAIRQHKQDGSFIVLLHGGKEHYPHPTPEMLRRCRFMVDMGADAVICCHTHCPITWETHAGKPIVYGLGNLIFEPLRKVPPDWHEGYLATLLFEGSGIRLQITPYNQSASLPGAQRMSGDAAKRFIASFEQQSLRLQDGAFIAEEWRKYCLTKKPEYLPGLFAYNRYMHRFRGLLLGRLHTKKGILGALLLSQCETHQEVLSTLFREERKSWDE